MTADLLSEFTSPSLSPSLLQSLLHRLFADPTIHNGFIDLLNLPSVQAALTNNPQRDIIVRTIELFGCGTVVDYYELKDQVWSLNEVQLEKLRMLSVVSVVKRRMEDARGVGGDVDMANESKPTASQRWSRRRTNKNKNGVLSIPYSELATKLHLPPDDTRKLEDLLIQCVYANLLSAKLDQCSKSLVVEPTTALVRDSTDASKNVEICGSILSRDLNLSSSDNPQLSKMISQLQTFLSHSTSLLATLEQSTNTNVALKKCDAARWKEVNRLVSEGNSNVKFGALERASEATEGGERDRREVKRSKMQAMMQRFS